MTQPNCLNCQQSLSEAYTYCPHCGQASHLHRINGAYLMHDAVHFFTHADKGIFFLIKELALRPGKVAREYIGGMRKKYFSPLNFFFIVLGVFVFSVSFFHTFEQRSSMAEARAEIMKIKDPALREMRLAKMNRAEKAMRFVGKYSNFVSMMATPLMALIFFLFYCRRKYNYTEHLVAHLYMSGFTGLIFIFIIAPAIRLAGKDVFYLALIFFYLLFVAVYKGIAYYQFMEQKGRKGYVRAFAASFTASLLWYIASTNFMVWYIQSGFSGRF